jgi:hypothetical protein
MEQVVMVHATVAVTMAVHGTEVIDEDDMRRRLEAAMVADAAAFIVCAERAQEEFPPWIASVNRLDVSFDRIRTVYSDLA